MDLIFQVPMEYCPLQHENLLAPPDTSTTGHCFHFGSASSFFLELFLYSSPVANWTPTKLGNFQCHIFLPFHTVHMTCSLFKYLVFPVGSDGKESACSAGEPISIPGLGRSPGEGNDNPLQYSCLENSVDRGAWWATVLGVMKSWTLLRD